MKTIFLRFEDRKFGTINYLHILKLPYLLRQEKEGNRDRTQTKKKKKSRFSIWHKELLQLCGDIIAIHYCKIKLVLYKE